LLQKSYFHSQNLLPVLPELSQLLQAL